MTATVRGDQVAATPDATLPADGLLREPKGFALRYFFGSYGIFLALFAPGLGGLSVRVQALVGLEQAPTVLGLVLGSGAFFALITQPLVGRLSDRTTARTGMRKPWIIVGAVGTFLGILVITVAPNITMLIVGWAMAQLFANFAQAALTATVADQVPEVRRGRVSGIIGTTAPLGILTGALGLTLLPNDLLRMGIPAAIGLIACLMFAFLLKDRVLTTKPDRFDFRDFFASFVFNPAKHRNLGWAWLSKLMIMFGYASTVTYLILFLATSFGITDIGKQLQFNLLATVVLVSANVVFAILGGWWSDKIQNRRLFVAAGAVMIAIGVLMFPVAPALGTTWGLGLILVAEAFIGAGAGFFLSVDMALSIAVLPNAEEVGKDLGVLNIANTLPQTLSPLIAGVVIIPLGDTLFGAGYSLWFIVAAAVALVGAVMVYRIKGVR